MGLAHRATPCKLRTTRLVSFAQRAIAAIEYVVEPVDEPLRIVVQSELVANEPMPAATQSDPRRRGRCCRAPLESERHGDHDLRAIARPPDQVAAGCGWPPARTT